MTDPQSVGPDPYQFITGDLGGTDTADAFLFFFGGGLFGAIGQLTTGDPVFLALFFPGDPITPFASNADGLLNAGFLAPGNYVLGDTLSADADPPFTFSRLSAPPPSAFPPPSAAPRSTSPPRWSPSYRRRARPWP